MVHPSWISELQQLLGTGDVLLDPQVLHNYSGDEFPDSRIRKSPRVAVRPRTAEQVSQILKLANREKIPVTPRGGGTGLCGGCVPESNGIALLMDHFNKVLDVDKENLMVTAEAGVHLRDLYTVIEKDGLFFPPHPGEETAMVGGVIATNAGGSRTVKYGTLRQFLRGVEVVLPQGDILHIGGKLVKNSTGFNLMHLFVGSEGLLGIFTQATIALLPKPRHTITLIAPYPSIVQAIRTVPEIIRRDLQPLAVEFMELDSIELTERQLHRSWPVKGAQAFLLIVIEQPGSDDSRLTDMAAVCESYGAGDIFVAETAEKQRDVLDFRSQMYEALKPWCMEILDIVVPRSEIAGHVEAVHALEKEWGAWLPTYGHAGDGNVHTHIMRVGFRDGKPDFEMKADWDALYPVLRKRLHEDARKRGGLVSGEHGIGLAKKELLREFVGPTQMAMMQGIKKMLDPNGILNPGKMF